MKKYLVFLLALVLLGAVGCKGKQNPPDPVGPEDPVTPVDPTDPDEPVVPEGATKVEVARIQVQPMGTRMFYMLYDDVSGKGFVFPIILDEGKDDVEPGKTYVYPGEMDKTYAYWMLSDYTTHALYTDATFKKTLKSEDKIRIDATATDTNGDKWVLVYDEN